ncbi:MAG: HPt (histidine-containing phosphotransfer) domain-containing protein [Candidatus Latescibacterota bacterium]|jgi:HPt (histidine-containing phosphotransfer) domain-containing protein
MNDHVAKPIDPVALFKTMLRWIAPSERDFYEKMMRQFCDGDQARTVEAVKTLLTEENREEAERAAHSLKGVAGTLGAMELERRAQGLEAAIKNGDDTYPHLDAVQQELDRLLPLIQEALGHEAEDGTLR